MFFLLFGFRSSHYATQALPDTRCPHCHQVGTLRVGLVSRYAHVCWIPLFPCQKIAVTECSHCHADWVDRETPATLASDVNVVKAQAHHPYWTWAGLTLLAGLVAFGVLTRLRGTRTDDTFLDSPRAGDSYTERVSSADAYSLLKMRQVSGNGAELVANEHQTTSRIPLGSLNEPTRYSQESFVLTRHGLQLMRRQCKLTNVERL